MYLQRLRACGQEQPLHSCPPYHGLHDGPQLSNVFTSTLCKGCRQAALEAFTIPWNRSSKACANRFDRVKGIKSSNDNLAAAREPSTIP